MGASAALLPQGAWAGPPSDAEIAGEEADVHCDAEPLADYNLNLAIGSVFVMLIISFAGAAFPALLALKRHPSLVLAIKLGSFAGSGVLLATGFVHMLLSSIENLSSPCLSEGWLASYPSWGILFCVLTIVVLQVLDYSLAVAFEPITNGDQPQLDIASLITEEADPILDSTTTNGIIVPPTTIASPPSPPSLVLDVEQGGGGGGCSNCGATNSNNNNNNCITTTTTTTSKLSPRSTSGESSAESEPNECNTHPICKDKDCNGRTLLPAPEVSWRSRAVSGLIMSEVSICTHSIIIGITLGAAASSEFTALFIAIIFHQLLEGIALGSNASETGIPTKTIILLAATYALTTPIGIAVGIGVRYSLNTNSVPMLLTTGILDAISAGTLIFLALGDHMNALKSQAGWLRAQRIAVQLSCFAAFFTGAAIMLTLALWA